MNAKKTFLGVGLSILLLTGCSQTKAPSAGSPPPAKQTPAATLSSPFAATRQLAEQFLQSGRPAYIEPQEVYQKAVVERDPSYYLVDIRSDENFAAHHIPGAIHISYADVWRSNKTDFLPRDKKIIVIDYSGHSSSQTAAFWSMLGFDAVAMKHGMAGWSKNKEVIGGSPLPCEPKNYPTVTKPATSAAVGAYDLPKLELQAANEVELLRKRAEAISAKPVVIQADDLLSRVKDKSIFVLDIRDSVFYQAGHIETAVSVPFRQLLQDSGLKQLPPDKPIAVVCYDGHLASKAARLLNQLGYDAVALRDGMSVWSSDPKVIGAKAVACDLPERLTAKLNAPLSPAPSAAAT